MIDLKKIKRLKDINYSVRRMYVDDFFERAVDTLPQKAKILDMGGWKEGKKGYFDIENYGFDVKYANLNKKQKPDYLCNIENIPVADDFFDVVILSEVVEHLENPEKVLQEAHRILKKDGKILICTPFLFFEHQDPKDFGRYSTDWYNHRLEQIGFSVEKIERQGAYYSVLMNDIKTLFYVVSKYKFKRGIMNKFISMFSYFLCRIIIVRDGNKYVENYGVLKGFTTGFGVVAQKIEKVN